MKPRASSPKSQDRTITVQTKAEAFEIRGFFTDYRIERSDDFFVVHFADSLSMRSPRKAFFSCAFDIHALLNLRQTLSDYIAKMEVPKSAYRSQADIYPSETVDLANIVGMAYSGNVSETTLFNFPTKLASVDVETKEINAQAVACLRSSARIQYSLVVEIYEQID